VRACQCTACLGSVAILTMASLAVTSSHCVCGVRSSDRKHLTPTPTKAIHYLALGILVPLLLSILANSSSLTCKGGSANVGMIMDWCKHMGHPTSTGRCHHWNTFDMVYGSCIQFSAARDAPWHQFSEKLLCAWLIATNVVSCCTTCNGGVSDFTLCEA